MASRNKCRKFSKIVCSFFISALIFISTSGLVAASSKTYRWKFLAVVPTQHPNGKILLNAFKQIEQRTDGKLKIRFVNFAQTPYKANEALRIIRDGLAEGVAMLNGYNTTDAPLLGAPELPFLQPKFERDPRVFYDNVAKCWNHPTVQSKLQPVWDRFNAVPLGRFNWGINELFTRQVVSSPDEIRNKQIREYSSEGSDVLRALGGSAVILTGAEVYTAIQRGVSDGFISSCQSSQMLKWYEVVKSMYVMHWKGGSSFLVYNRDKVNSLPAEFRKVLREEHAAAADAINDFTTGYLPKCEKWMAGQKDWTVTYIADRDYGMLREKAKQHAWKNWIAKRAGTDGREMLNACLSLYGESVDF